MKSPMAMLYFLQFFIAVSLSGLEATFAYFAAVKAGLNAVSMGYVFIDYGPCKCDPDQGFDGKADKEIWRNKNHSNGNCCFCFSMGLILLTQNFLTAAVFLTIFGVGNGVIRPSVSSLLTKQAKSGYGEVTGYLSSFGSLGRIIGPVLGGALYMVWIGLPYVSGIVLSAIAFGLFMIYIKRNKLSIG